MNTITQAFALQTFTDMECKKEVVLYLLKASPLIGIREDSPRAKNEPLKIIYCFVLG